MSQNIQEANERFQEKKREEILQLIPEQFHKQVVQALNFEEEEEYDKVEEICQEILKEESGREVEQVKIILARIYPRLLRMDVNNSNQKYQKDLQSYYAFLDSIQMNTLMQEYVVETLIRLCELMENPWYRPLFKEFVEHIEEKGYLTEDTYKKTLASAYASMESYSYYADRKLSLLVKTALKSNYDRAYTMQDEKLESTRTTMLIDALTNDWFLCQYYEEHTEEFSYLAEQYPYSYQLLAGLVEEIQKDKSKKEDEILDTLMEYVKQGTTKEKLQEVMEKSYKDLLIQADKPQTVYAGGGTYHRNMEKIGRNDLCPCGSGKKYKQCCGR